MWTLWQNGISLYIGDVQIFAVKEIPYDCTSSPYRDLNNKFQLKQEGIWNFIDISKTCILEIIFPATSLVITRVNDNLEKTEIQQSINNQSLTSILSLCVDHIDILLEDWYPTLGTRFIHTSEGRFLVTRLIPCPKCLQQGILFKKEFYLLNLTCTFLR